MSNQYREEELDEEVRKLQVGLVSRQPVDPYGATRPPNVSAISKSVATPANSSTDPSPEWASFAGRMASQTEFVPANKNKSNTQSGTNANVPNGTANQGANYGYILPHEIPPPCDEHAVCPGFEPEWHGEGQQRSVESNSQSRYVSNRSGMITARIGGPSQVVPHDIGAPCDTYASCPGGNHGSAAARSRGDTSFIDRIGVPSGIVPHGTTTARMGGPSQIVPHDIGAPCDTYASCPGGNHGSATTRSRGDTSYIDRIGEPSSVMPHATTTARMGGPSQVVPHDIGAPCDTYASCPGGNHGSATARSRGDTSFIARAGVPSRVMPHGMGLPCDDHVVCDTNHSKSAISSRVMPHQIGAPCDQYASCPGNHTSISSRVMPHQIGAPCDQYASCPGNHTSISSRVMPHQIGAPCDQYASCPGNHTSRSRIDASGTPPSSGKGKGGKGKGGQSYIVPIPLGPPCDEHAVCPSPHDRDTGTSHSPLLMYREWAPMTSLLTQIPARVPIAWKNFEVRLTCLAGCNDYLVLGTNASYLLIFDLPAKKLIHKLRCSESVDVVTSCAIQEGLEYVVAAGLSTGAVAAFRLPSKFPGRKHEVTNQNVAKTHSSPVIALTFSPNCELLFTGDESGVVVRTVLSSEWASSDSDVLLKASSPVVQMAYSLRLLLISTETQCFVWDSRTKVRLPVGTKDRKTPGPFGCCWMTRGGVGGQRATLQTELDLFTSRPGCRVWVGDTTGAVISTLLLKDHVSSAPIIPLVTSLNDKDGPGAATDNHTKDQLGPLLPLQNGLLLSWSGHSVYLLQPTGTGSEVTNPPNSTTVRKSGEHDEADEEIHATIVARCHAGPVLGACVCGDDVYILRPGVQRRLVRLAPSHVIFQTKKVPQVLLPEPFKSDGKLKGKKHPGVDDNQSEGHDSNGKANENQDDKTKSIPAKKTAHAEGENMSRLKAFSQRLEQKMQAGLENAKENMKTGIQEFVSTLQKSQQHHKDQQQDTNDVNLTATVDDTGADRLVEGADVPSAGSPDISAGDGDNACGTLNQAQTAESQGYQQHLRGIPAEGSNPSSPRTGQRRRAAKEAAILSFTDIQKTENSGHSSPDEPKTLAEELAEAEEARLSSESPTVCTDSLKDRDESANINDDLSRKDWDKAAFGNHASSDEEETIARPVRVRANANDDVPGEEARKANGNDETLHHYTYEDLMQASGVGIKSSDGKEPTSASELDETGNVMVKGKGHDKDGMNMDGQKVNVFSESDGAVGRDETRSSSSKERHYDNDVSGFFIQPDEAFSSIKSENVMRNRLVVDDVIEMTGAENVKANIESCNVPSARAVSEERKTLECGSGVVLQRAGAPLRLGSYSYLNDSLDHDALSDIPSTKSRDHPENHYELKGIQNSDRAGKYSTGVHTTELSNSSPTNDETSHSNQEGRLVRGVSTSPKNSNFVTKNDSDLPFSARTPPMVPDGEQESSFAVISPPKLNTRYLDRLKSQKDDQEREEDGNEEAVQGDQDWPSTVECWTHSEVPCPIVSLSVCDSYVTMCDKHEQIWYCELRKPQYTWKRVSREKATGIQTAMSPTGDVIWALRGDGRAVAGGIRDGALTPQHAPGSGWSVAGGSVAALTPQHAPRYINAASEVKCIAVDKSCVWYLKEGGEIKKMSRTTSKSPISKSQSMAFNRLLSKITCRNGVLWGLTTDGRLCCKQVASTWCYMEAPKECYSGSKSSHSRTHNKCVVKAGGSVAARVEGDGEEDGILEVVIKDLSVGGGGVLWVIDEEGRVWFKTGVTRERPEGEAEWWLVSISDFVAQSAPVAGLYSAAASGFSQALQDGFKQTAAGFMSRSHGGLITAAHDAVIVSTETYSLNICRGFILGHRWEKFVLPGVASSAQWTSITLAPGNNLWAVQNHRELFNLPLQKSYPHGNTDVRQSMATPSHTRAIRLPRMSTLGNAAMIRGGKDRSGERNERRKGLSPPGGVRGAVASKIGPGRVGSPGGKSGNSRAGHAGKKRNSGKEDGVSSGGRVACLSAAMDAVWVLGEGGDVIISSRQQQKAGDGGGRGNLGNQWQRMDMVQFQADARRLVHLSCSNLSVWAVDNDGAVLLRLGAGHGQDLHMSPAWIPADLELPRMGSKFTKVYVSPGEQTFWMVWALDDRSNLFVRRGVTEEYPIGSSWIHVIGSEMVQLALSDDRVWALSAEGEIYCRYGISPCNIQGDYWKKIPGVYTWISVTDDNRLWAIAKDGGIYRHSFHVVGSRLPSQQVEEEDWEII